MREGPLGLLASCPNAPKWSIPSSNRGALVSGNDAPGPGQYDVGLALEALRPRRFQENSFPKALKENKDLPKSSAELGSNCTKMPARVTGGVLREAATDPSDPKSTTPGPEYCPPSSLKRQGAVYMGDFPVRRRDRPSSAPGRSDTSETGSKGDPSKAAGSQRPGFSFGRSQRETPERTSPDTMYMPPSTLRTRAASCLNGHRPVFESEEVRPDPQTYAKEQLGTSEPRGAFGAARRWRSEAALDRLGPGTYQTDTPAVVKGVVRMSSAKRFVDAEADGLPGPGAYHPAASSTRGGGNRTTFSRAPRQDPPKDFSHLGGERRAKVIRSFFRAGTLPPGTLRSRGPRLPPRSAARKAKGEKQPGPGSFHVAVKQDVSGCVFSTSPRWGQSAQDPGPGPGSYRVELESRPKLGKLAPKLDDKTLTLEDATQGAPGETHETPQEHRPGPDYKVYTLFPLE